MEPAVLEPLGKTCREHVGTLRRRTEEVACSGERVPGDPGEPWTERRWPIEEESASQPSGLDGSRKVVTFQMVCIPRVTCEVKVSLHHQAVTPTTIVV